MCYLNLLKKKKERYSAFKKVRFSTYLLVLLFTSCTTIGFHNYSQLQSLDFGEEKELRFCLYQDPKITNEQIDKLVYSLSQELKLYKIKLKITQKKEYRRKYFFTEDSLNALLQENLPIECDRILALFPRNIWDFLLAIPLPEILGVVETYTRTRGLVYADYFTPNLLLGATPQRIFIHESYHLLGCDHALWMDECYSRILYAKQIQSNSTFFPSFGTDTSIVYKSHEDVNMVLFNKE